MIFAPHKIQLWEDLYVEDEKGNLVKTEFVPVLGVKTLPLAFGDSLIKAGEPHYEDGRWIDLGFGRCDNASNETLYGQDGAAYNPLYKVVFDKSTLLRQGQKVRALREDGSVRGEGVVTRELECNYLDYQAVWLK